MRIAVCLSGQPRFLDNGYQQIFEKIISKYNDVDFFIHTWWNDELNAKGANRNYTFKSDTLKLIMDYYKPRLILNEPQMYFNIYNDVDYETINPISPYSMFYSIKVSNDLKSFYEKKNNFKYDVVIRCRFDILINRFDINLSDIDLSYIYTDTVGNGFPNDQLAISSSENMDYYCSLYDSINDYYNEGFRNFVGERLLRHHLKDSKLLFTDKIKNDIIKND
jgi:hypothetical protein